MAHDEKMDERFKDLEVERELAPVFAELTGSAQPEGQWQARVWARIARAPEEATRRRRLRIWQGASAMLALLLLVGAGLAYRFGHRLSQENAEIQFKHKEALSVFRDEVERAQREIEQLILSKDEAIEKRLAARSEVEREQAEAERAALERELAAKRKALAELRDAQARRGAAAREKAKRVNAKCDPNDPLCGL